MRKITDLSDNEVRILLDAKLIMDSWSNLKAQEFCFMVDSGGKYFITAHNPFLLNRLLTKWNIDIYNN
jgi:hypothetical protein